jgi:nuclear pore complex protein Nup107
MRPFAHVHRRNVVLAIKFADLVADARFKITSAFGRRDGGCPLSVYLDAMREAMLVGLENGGSDPFNIVA